MNPAHADSDPVSITNRTRDECSGLATLGWPQTEAGRHRPPATGLDKQKEPAVVTEFKLTPNAVRTPRAAAVAGILFALLLGTALGSYSGLLGLIKSWLVGAVGRVA